MTELAEQPRSRHEIDAFERAAHEQSVAACRASCEPAGCSQLAEQDRIDWARYALKEAA